MKKDAGYTLIEIIIVLMIVAVVAAVSVSGLYGTASDAGGAEKVLEDFAGRITERRIEAVRLNGEDRRTGVNFGTAPPLPIDFAVLTQTASLRTDGTDADNDCLDDQTGKSLTCLYTREGNIRWNLAFHDDALKLPKGWKLLTESGLATPLPLIADGHNGRGRPAVAVAFDATGRAFAREPGDTEFRRYPTGFVIAEEPDVTQTPFWAVYFYLSGPVQGERGEVLKSAVAVAVYPSGLVEKFRLDGKQWIGFKNRIIGGDNDVK